MISVKHSTEERQRIEGDAFSSPSDDGVQRGAYIPGKWVSRMVEITRVFEDGRYVMELPGRVSLKRATAVIEERKENLRLLAKKVASELKS